MNIEKYLILICIALTFFGCKQSEPDTDSFNNQTSIDDEVMLFGSIDRSGLQMPEYATWFEENYRNYVPNDSISELLESQLRDIEIKIFMGTWCSDSQRDVPAFYRILDEIDANLVHEIVAVDRSKKRPTEHVEGYDIEYVPTFIIYRNQKELGRIVEIPETSLEEDLLHIISGS